jgi:hypothetical protein
VVGVFVDHDLIARPIPIGDDVVIIRGDVPVKIIKPETLPVSSTKHEYMLRSKATGEAPVCPRLRHVVMRIAGSTIVSDPPIVPGVDVRNAGMTRAVHGNVVLWRGIGLRAALSGGSSRRLGSSRWLGGPRRSGTACRNVSTANRGVTAALWSPAASSVLRDCRDTDQNG